MYPVADVAQHPQGLNRGQTRHNASGIHAPQPGGGTTPGMDLAEWRRPSAVNSRLADSGAVRRRADDNRLAGGAF